VDYFVKQVEHHRQLGYFAEQLKAINLSRKMNWKSRILDFASLNLPLDPRYASTYPNFYLGITLASKKPETNPIYAPQLTINLIPQLLREQ